jgi:hypothetical protein
MLSETICIYLFSKIFNGKTVLGKKIAFERGKTGNSLMHGIKVTLSMNGNAREQKGLRKSRETGMRW